METPESRTTPGPPRSASFERFSGVCAVLAGVSGFLYAVAFVVLQDELLSGLFLMLAVYERLRETDASFALLALLRRRNGRTGGGP